MRILLLMYFVHFLRHGMVLPVVPLFAQDLGAGASMVGLVVGSFNALSLLLGLVVGDLADRISIKKMLIAGAVCNLVYSLLLYAAVNPWALVGTQIIGGLGFLLLIVCTQAYISGLPGVREREKNFSRVTLAAAVGQSTGPLCGGWLLSIGSFDLVFAAAIGVSLLGAVVFGLRMDASRTGRAKPFEPLAEKLAKLTRMARNPRMAIVLAFTLGVILAVCLRGSFLPILLQSKGVSGVYIGAMLSVFAVSMTLVRVMVGRILGRFSRLGVMTFVLVVTGSAVGILPLLDQAWALATVLAVFGLGFGLSQPLSMVMVSESSADDRRGLAMGLRFSTLTLGTFLGPLMMGALAEIGGISLPFYCAVLPILAVGLALFLFRNKLNPEKSS
ncbi:MAG: MFS transporter [Desulfonatronovibrionaceae bacterium]